MLPLHHIFRNRGIFRCFFHQLPTAKIFLGDPGQLNGGVLSHGGYPVPMKSQSRRWSRLETYGDWESLIFFWKSQNGRGYSAIAAVSIWPPWDQPGDIISWLVLTGTWLDYDFIYTVYIYIYIYTYIYIYIGNNHIFQLTFRIFGLWLSIQ